MIWNYLSNTSYWAKNRSQEVVSKSIENSLCFGVYLENNSQIGFARVVTDYTIFAWVLDVFVIDEYQREGAGDILMNAIMEHEKLKGIRRWGLCTLDAQKFYKRHGFNQLDDAEMHMELVNVL